MTIRAVFLDVDDTLVDYQTAARAAFHFADFSCKCQPLVEQLDELLVTLV